MMATPEELSGNPRVPASVWSQSHKRSMGVGGLVFEMDSGRCGSIFVAWECWGAPGWVLFLALFLLLSGQVSR